MKVRNSSSKAFHKNQPSNQDIYSKSMSVLLQKINLNDSINMNQKQQIEAFKKIISTCYNNKSKQEQLCKLLNVPFIAGPISLNSIPQSFFNEQYLSDQSNKDENIMNQLSYLFDYLKKTKEYYYCWIIYYNQELKILTIKMMKKYQLDQNIQLLNKDYCLIGIFVDKQLNFNKNVENYQQQNSLMKNKINSHKLSSMSYSQSAGFNFNPSYHKKTKTKKILSKLHQKQLHSSSQSDKSESKTNSSSFQKENLSNDIKKQQNQFNLKQTKEVFQDYKKRNFKKKKNNQIQEVQYYHIQTKNKPRKSTSKNIILDQSKSQTKKLSDLLMKQAKSFSKLFSHQSSLKPTPKVYKNIKENQKKIKILRSISNKGFNQQQKQWKIRSPQHKSIIKSP